MSRSQRRAWIIFGGCATAVAVVMTWLTGVVLDLQAAVRAETNHQTALRLALWRMDTWLAPKLSREAARPYHHYKAYYPQQTAYTKVLGEIAAGEVLTPSPLLSNRYDFFPLHFQYDAQGGLTSPQVPKGNWLDLAAAKGQTRIDLDTCSDQLDSLRQAVEVSVLAERITGAEQELAARGCLGPLPLVNPPAQLFEQNEYNTRSQMTNAAKLFDPEAGRDLRLDEVSMGPLVPLWLDHPTGGAAVLVFVRRVQVRDQTLFQGALADWPALRAALLEQVTDVLPPGQASLARMDQPTGEQEGRMLATVPALLTAPAPPPAATPWSPTHTVLMAAWLAMVLAVGAVGFTLRSTMALGERRARFASAVTHELRTPLTTFRMYSEMLADDMVQEPAQRATYLSTLRNEADRLSRLVENVLCFARLEDGRYRGRRARITVGDLLERVAPPLRQRAAEAEMTLDIAADDDAAEVEVDVDAITQILFNLVDNASKYAAGHRSSSIELSASVTGESMALTVRDYGPGIPREHRSAIFRPFERGERHAGDNATPGVGLGLALSRGLAKDLGGSLALDTDATPGARFTLRIPT